MTLVLCACALGFLLFNFSPAKIFMGNSGSYFMGTLFGIISIRIFSGEKKQIFPLVLFLLLIFFVPVFDTLFVFIRRISSRKLFYQGGCDHISHTLVDSGLSERKTVLLLYLVNFISAALAFLILFLTQGWDCHAPQGSLAMTNEGILVAPRNGNFLLGVIFQLRNWCIDQYFKFITKNIT